MGRETQPVQLRLMPCSEGRTTVILRDRPVLEFNGVLGRAVVLPDRPSHIGVADILRWGAPIALLSLGINLLHSGAVARADRVLAFVGQGGIGKSTIARAAASVNWSTICDDMLIVDDDLTVDPRCERLLVDWCSHSVIIGRRDTFVDYAELAQEIKTLGESDHGARARLQSIAFLQTPRTADGRFHSLPLNQMQAMHGLLQQSFATLPHPEARARHWDACGRISRRVLAFKVRAPEGDDQMRAALPAYLDSALREGSDFPVC